MYGLVEMEDAVADFCISLAHWGLFPFRLPSDELRGWATAYFTTWDF